MLCSPANHHARTEQPLSGFYRLTVEERRQALEATDLSEEAVEALASADALSEEAADHMIENVVGRFVLPVGLATNFIVDGEEVPHSLRLEESSVVAAASNMARRCRSTGGFVSSNDPPIMIACPGAGRGGFGRRRGCSDGC